MNFKLLTALIFAGTAAVAGSAHAVNWGATVGYTGAEVEDEPNNGIDPEGDITFFSIGVTMDTSRPTSIFGYRGTLSYITGEYEPDRAEDSDYSGFAFYNTFGFRVAGGANQRFWIGPAIDLQVADLDDDSGFESATGVGIGASVGVDFYQQSGQFLSLEGGVRYGAISLDRDNEFSDSGDLDLDYEGVFLRGSYFFFGSPAR